MAKILSKYAYIMRGAWQQIQNIGGRNYTCGHKDCGREIGSEKGWWFNDPYVNGVSAWIYVCPICQRPTFFDEENQIPGDMIGHKIDHLPKEIYQLYEEVRKCTSHNSYTTAVLACRKILMHIAVEKGAKDNLSFTDYVSYLADNHYSPQGSTVWVDRIRKKSNEANHEIKIMKRDDALELVTFIEMLLKFIYEFPGNASVVATIQT